MNGFNMLRFSYKEKGYTFAIEIEKTKKTLYFFSLMTKSEERIGLPVSQ